jgi:hypothetical protein
MCRRRRDIHDKTAELIFDWFGKWGAIATGTRGSSEPLYSGGFGALDLQMVSDDCAFGPFWWKYPSFVPSWKLLGHDLFN